MNNFCIDCGKETKGYGKRCNGCARIYWHKEKGHYLTSEKNFCIKCKKEISRRATRCKSCAIRKTFKDKGYILIEDKNHFCLDCGAKLKNGRAQRCPSCASRKRALEKWKNPTEKMCNHLKIMHELPPTEKQIKWNTELNKLPRTKKQLKNFQSSWEDKFYDEYLFPIFRDCDLRRQYYLKELNHAFDFAILECKVLIEVDGDYTHSRPGRKERDVEINEFVWRTYPDWQLFRYNDKDMKKLGII